MSELNRSPLCFKYTNKQPYCKHWSERVAVNAINYMCPCLECEKSDCTMECEIYARNHGTPSAQESHREICKICRYASGLIKTR